MSITIKRRNYTGDVYKFKSLEELKAKAWVKDFMEITFFKRLVKLDDYLVVELMDKRFYVIGFIVDGEIDLPELNLGESDEGD